MYVYYDAPVFINYAILVGKLWHKFCGMFLWQTGLEENVVDKTQLGLLA